MSTPSQLLLVDIHQLSKQRCKLAIQGDLKYATSENFLGRQVAGYSETARDIFLMTPFAAAMLCKVQDYLIENYVHNKRIWQESRWCSTFMRIS